MTVSIRNPLIRNTRIRPGVVAGATSTRGNQVARRSTQVAATTARATWLRRRRPRYRYRLASIDVIFAATSEPANVKSMADRRDHRLAAVVFFFGLITVVASSIGAAYLIKQFVNFTLTS